MAITVTSKYKPFTYEELVKPLEGYWEKYDKAEQSIADANAEIAYLDSYLKTLPDIEGNTTHKQAVTNYITNLDNLSTQLSKNGLTHDLKKQISGLKETFNRDIKLTAEAASLYQKALEAERQKVAEGYIIGANSTSNQSLDDYYGTNRPEATLSLSVSDLAKETGAMTKNITSQMDTIFKDSIADLVGKSLTGYATQKGIKPTDFLNENVTSTSNEGRVINGIRSQIKSWLESKLGVSYDSLDQRNKDLINNTVDDAILSTLQYDFNIHTYKPGSKDSRNTEKIKYIGTGTIPTDLAWKQSNVGQKYIKSTTKQNTDGTQTTEYAKDPWGRIESTKNSVQYRMENILKDKGLDFANIPSDIKPSLGLMNDTATEITGYQEGQNVQLYQTGNKIFMYYKVPKFEKNSEGGYVVGKDGKYVVKRDKDGNIQYDHHRIYLSTISNSEKTESEGEDFGFALPTGNGGEKAESYKGKL